MRIKAICEYDGTRYGGWQRQENADTVQAEIENALCQLLMQPTPITGAGRTDAGVHARGQVYHFDTDTRIPPQRLAYAANYLLPRDIRIISTEQVRDTFSARYDACEKWYRYQIYHRAISSPLHHRTFWHIPYPDLDLNAMRSALLCLLGEHDFRAFMATGSQSKTTVRKITKIALEDHGEEIILDIWGNAFLYNMVRIIAGTAVDIGRGKREKDAFARMLSSGNRTEGGQTAPPQGLCLMQIWYPEKNDGEKKENS